MSVNIVRSSMVAASLVLATMVSAQDAIGFRSADGRFAEFDLRTEALRRDPRVVATRSIDLRGLDAWVRKRDGEIESDLPAGEPAEPPMPFTMTLPLSSDKSRVVMLEPRIVSASVDFTRYALYGPDGKKYGGMLKDGEGRIEGSIYVDGEFYALVPIGPEQVEAALLDSRRARAFESLPAPVDEASSLLDLLQETQQRPLMWMSMRNDKLAFTSPLLLPCAKTRVNPSVPMPSPSSQAPPPTVAAPITGPAVINIQVVMTRQACWQRLGVHSARCTPSQIRTADLESLTATLEADAQVLIDAFKAEGIDVIVRLHSALLGPKEPSNRLCDTLASALTGTDYEEIRDQRRITKADLTAIVVARDGISATRDRGCGQVAVINVAERNEAVLLLNLACLNSQTLAHEIGHLLGASHEPAALVAEGIVAADPTAHAFARSDREIGTLVSTQESSNRRLARWSNPAAMWALDPNRFIALGDDLCCHDALIVKRNLPRLAGFGDQL